MALPLQEAMGGRDDINDNNNHNHQHSNQVSNNGTNDETMTDSSSSRDSDTSSQGSAGRTGRKEVRKSNVSELVAKSKKAASSLWTLLHAKVSLSGSGFMNSFPKETNKEVLVTNQSNKAERLMTCCI